MKGASSHAGRSSGCQRGTDLVPSPKSLRWYPICTALAIRLCPRHCSWDSGFSGSKYRPTDRNFQKITLPLPPNQVHTATTYTMRFANSIKMFIVMQKSSHLKSVPLLCHEMWLGNTIGTDVMFGATVASICHAYIIMICHAAGGWPLDNELCKPTLAYT